MKALRCPSLSKIFKFQGTISVEWYLTPNMYNLDLGLKSGCTTRSSQKEIEFIIYVIKTCGESSTHMTHYEVRFIMCDSCLNTTIYGRAKENLDICKDSLMIAYSFKVYLLRPHVSFFVDWHLPTLWRRLEDPIHVKIPPCRVPRRKTPYLEGCESAN